MIESIWFCNECHSTFVSPNEQDQEDHDLEECGSKETLNEGGNR